MARGPARAQGHQETPLIRTELKRWMTTESLWNKNDVSRASPDAELNRQPKSPRKLKEEEAIGPRVSKAIASNV